MEVCILQKQMKIDYLIEVKEILIKQKINIQLDVFKDFYKYSGLLSTIKTNNRMLNTWQVFMLKRMI